MMRWNIDYWENKVSSLKINVVEINKGICYSSNGSQMCI